VRISVVLPCYNGEDTLGSQLHALARPDTRRIAYEWAASVGFALGLLEGMPGALAIARRHAPTPDTALAPVFATDPSVSGW
jgi:hypothetical protein